MFRLYGSRAVSARHWSISSAAKPEPPPRIAPACERGRRRTDEGQRRDDRRADGATRSEHRSSEPSRHVVERAGVVGRFEHLLRLADFDDAAGLAELLDEEERALVRNALRPAACCA